MKRSGQLKRSQGLSKRSTKRRTTTPRCVRQRCGKPAKIRDLCLSHAEREADRLFSLWVRARDDRCTFPLLDGYGPHGGPLQAAHGEPRANHATRYDPRNVHALCRDHHYAVDKGSKHALKAVWLTDVLGLIDYSLLLDDAMVPMDRGVSIEIALEWLT